MSRAFVAAVVLSTALLAAPSQGIQRPGAPAAGQSAAPAELSLPNEDDSVKFAVIGDTGTGGREQYQIAAKLTDIRARFPYEFVVMLGDNMYGGESPSDFVKKFETPYKGILDAGVKFYAALGNHDEPAQRFYKPFNMDGQRYYTVRKGDVEFFVLDSTYFSPAQLEWLKEELSKSDAKWKIPYMHHPIYSSGERHGSEIDLRALVEPLFVEHGVDVVFAGHEHFYERLKPQNGIVYITEGGSAKLRAGNISNRSTLTEKGFDTDQSFMVVEIVKDQMFFETWSRRGSRVDSGIIPRREVTPTVHATTN
jgi:predicted phosphodiesterase